MPDLISPTAEVQAYELESGPVAGRARGGQGARGLQEGAAHPAPGPGPAAWRGAVSASPVTARARGRSGLERGVGTA